MAVIALPFMWVGISMSVRRAADAGISPWAGVVFFVPLLNYVAMIVLSALPSKEGRGWQLPPGFSYRAVPHPPSTELAPSRPGVEPRSRALSWPTSRATSRAARAASTRR